MATVNGVNSNNNVNVVDSSKLSQQDFVSAVYLERGNMLDSEVRKLLSEIETSNKLLGNVNTLINKSNIAQYGTSQYKQTTWTTNGNNIVLDNGYGIAIQPDANGKTTFTLVDAEGNQLNYQNQALVPVAKGSISDAKQVGIPVMNDMTMVLDDGTEITFQTSAPGTPFDPSNLSGGLADITGITITRGNQGLTVTDLNTAKPVIGTPNLNGTALDAASNDGYVLLEAGGLHSWEFDGVNTNQMSRKDPNDSSQTLSGYAARKVAFQNSFTNEVTGGMPALTQEERDVLSNLLKINYTDASGKGQLTPEEWASLKTSLNAAKENLTGSNQLQTVQLQRAMTTYNQNFDTMSNSQSKIYTLLKDIISNSK
ncbi:hypothetical protein [Endozoicomonas sp. ALB032]|uniref:hypothetical protein n=1 Tax=Endozoicomonas sp. ALB032 TaxID=3403082 RepID=UPI003BB53C8B